MIDYALVTKLWRANKSALIRAKNQKDWAKVKKVCDKAFEDMDAHGYPDDWALFQRSRDDADMALRRQAAGLPI